MANPAESRALNRNSPVGLSNYICQVVCCCHFVGNGTSSHYLKQCSLLSHEGRRNIARSRSNTDNRLTVPTIASLEQSVEYILKRKEGRDVLFNDKLNTYLCLYGVRHIMVKDHSDKEETRCHQGGSKRCFV